MEEHKYLLEISMDDKTYICPSASTGMRGARNQRIFQSSDEKKARKLPTYDFPVSMVNIVLSTYRIMSKEVIYTNEKYETQIFQILALYLFAQSIFWAVLEQYGLVNS